LEDGQTLSLSSLKAALAFTALRTGLRPNAGQELDVSLALIFGRQVNFTNIPSDGRKSQLMPPHELEKKTFYAEAWDLLCSFQHFVAPVKQQKWIFL